MLVLGDELYLGTNHDALAAGITAQSTAVCAVLRTEDPEVVRKNYAVEVDDGRVTALIEKPDAPVGPWVGCGTFVFDPAIFAHARETPQSPRTGRLELIDVIQHAIERGAPVRPLN